MNRLIALTLILMLLCSCAAAEIFEGVTAAEHTMDAVSLAGGRLTGLDCLVGQTVTAGQLLAQTEPHRVFATQDGTIARIEYAVNEKADGTVLTLAPVSRYTVHCTTDGAADQEGNTWIRVGEEVLVRCTRNGTHRGVGIVTNVSGTEYTVMMVAGEMYVGESVYIHRKVLMDYDTRIGKGTVVAADDETYAVTGTILTLNVQPGDEVTRGQLLLTWSDDADLNITSPADGIITAIAHRNGESLTADAAVLTVTPYTDILISLSLTEEQAARVIIGTPAVYTLAADALELERTATVTRISELGENDMRTVWLTPDAAETMLGATVTVTLPLAAE